MKSGFPHLTAYLQEKKFLPVLFLLFLAGLFAYHRAIFYPFVHDDIVFIQQNPHIANFWDWHEIFRSHGPELSIANPYWRPGLEIIYRLEYQLFGLNPAGYHLFNILLHIANSGLLFYCLQILLQRSGLALAVAVLFLLHPVQSEAVACVAGISNLFYVFLCLLSFLFYIRAGSALPQEKDFPQLAAALGFYGFALLSKEQSLMFPLIILFYEFYLRRDFGKKDRLISIVKGLGGFVLISVVYLLLRKVLLGSPVVPIWLYQEEFFLRLLAIPRAILMYSQVLLWPSDLHYYRSIDILAPWQAAALGLITVAGGILFLVRSMPSATLRLFWFGVVWFFVTLLPTLNIIPIIHEYSIIAAFEHFLYLPMVGFFLAAFLLIEHWASKVFKDQWKGMSVLLVGLACLGITLQRTRDWRGEVSLFERVVWYEPKLGRARFLLGRAYYFNQQYDKAIKELEIAAAIMAGYLEKIKDPAARPFYSFFLKEIYFDWAHCYEAQGQWPAAIAQYEKILALAPEPAAAETHNSLGNVYVQMGDFTKAKPHFLEAVTLNPRHLMALSNLAVCHVRENNFAEAENLLNRALEVDPRFIPARRNLELLLLQKKSATDQGPGDSQQ